MKTVIAIYILAILALWGGLAYMNNALNSVQYETDTAVTEYTPLVVPQSNTRIMPTEVYQGGTGYGVEEVQTATVTIE